MRSLQTLLPAIGLLAAGGSVQPPAYELTIAHMADTHDRSEPRRIAVPAGLPDIVSY
jgi:hypothetical protein